MLVATFLHYETLANFPGSTSIEAATLLLPEYITFECILSLLDMIGIFLKGQIHHERNSTKRE